MLNETTLNSPHLSSRVGTNPLVVERPIFLLTPAVWNILKTWQRAYLALAPTPDSRETTVDRFFQRLLQEHEVSHGIAYVTLNMWLDDGTQFVIAFPSLNIRFFCQIQAGIGVVARDVAMLREAEPICPDEDQVVKLDFIFDRVGLVQLTGGTDDRGTTSSAAAIAAHLQEHAVATWIPFATEIRQIAEQEACVEEERTARLLMPYTWEGAPARDPSPLGPIYSLAVSRKERVAELNEGEGVILCDARGQERAWGIVVRTVAGKGSTGWRVEVRVRNGDDAGEIPERGMLQPRLRGKLIEQKRAVSNEMLCPTGALKSLLAIIANPRQAGGRSRPCGMLNFINPSIARIPSQARAVRTAVGLQPGSALLIQGPPGTGKSTCIAEVIAQILRQNPNARILECSHSNHGVDNVVEKVLRFRDQTPEISIARVGSLDRVGSGARPYFVPAGQSLDDYNVVFSTCDSLALHDTAGTSIYDYVILDEANRANILDSLLALSRGRRFILVGDHQQLQPVLANLDGEALRAAVNGVYGTSLFSWLHGRGFDRAAEIFLNVQNRMNPDIGELVSRVFYEGRVTAGRETPATSIGKFPFCQAVHWVDTKDLKAHFETKVRGKDLYNEPEARLVLRVVEKLDQEVAADNDIGVICAYAEQRDLLRRMLGTRDYSNRRLEIDTVDAFEGREKDIVIVSLVRSNRRGDIGFLKLIQRINVALSRARRLLILVGDSSTLRGSYFDQIYQYIAQNKGIIYGHFVVRLLTGQPVTREWLLNATRATKEAPPPRAPKAPAGSRRPPPRRNALVVTGNRARPVDLWLYEDSDHVLEDPEAGSRPPLPFLDSDSPSDNRGTHVDWAR